MSTKPTPASEVIGYLNIGNQRDEIRRIGGALWIGRCWHWDPIGQPLAALHPCPLSAAQRYMESPEFCLLKPLIAAAISDAREGVQP